MGSFTENIEADMDLLSSSARSFEFLLQSPSDLTTPVERRGAFRQCHSLLAELDDVAETYPAHEARLADIRDELENLIKLLRRYPLREEERASLKRFSDIFSHETSPSALALLYFQVSAYRSFFFPLAFKALASSISRELVKKYPIAMKLMAQEPGGRVYSRLFSWSVILVDLKLRLDSVFESIIACQETSKERKSAWQSFVSWKLLCIRMIVDLFGKKFPKTLEGIDKIETSLKIAQQAFLRTLAD